MNFGFQMFSSLFSSIGRDQTDANSTGVTLYIMAAVTEGKDLYLTIFSICEVFENKIEGNKLSEPVRIIRDVQTC